MNRILPVVWSTWSKLCWLVAASLIALSASADTLTEVSKDDTQKVRVVIQAQLDALAADDAPRAFSFASPRIRELVGSADNFISMVRTSYPVVYRPGSVVFLAPQFIDGILVQSVQMTDSAGAPWLAIYTMEKEDDGSWRISGCHVRANEGRAT